MKGPPPSVTFALSAPIVNYGTPITLSGAISTGAANQSVEIDATPYGQASPIQLVVVKTGTGGAFSYTVTPRLYTTYVARWNNTASGTVLVQVAPKLQLHRRQERLHEGPADGAELDGREARLPAAALVLRAVGESREPHARLAERQALQAGRVYLPKGISHIRVFLSVNQAGLGLLAAHSGTQTVNKK